MFDQMNVFTYGSLMFPAVWQRVVRDNYRSAIATVHGFKRVCVRDRQHPALIIAPRALPVQGRVYFNVSAADLARLDYFETDNYARVAVAATVDAAAVSAQAYLALHFDLLVSQEWNVTSFEQQGLPVFLATYAAQHMPQD